MPDDVKLRVPSVENYDGDEKLQISDFLRRLCIQKNSFLQRSLVTATRTS